MTLRLTILLPGLLAATTALAHEGHGLLGASHWHASDSGGFLLLVLALAVLTWWARRK